VALKWNVLKDQAAAATAATEAVSSRSSLSVGQWSICTLYS